MAHVLGVNKKFIFKMFIYFFIGKALCNVSTTSNHNPDQVLDELTRALVAKGIPCQQKGYILRGKIKDASGNCLFRIKLYFHKSRKISKKNVFSVLLTTVVITCL